MLPSDLKIRQGTIEEAVELSLHIPEFMNPADVEIYRNRFSEKDHLILIAHVNQKPCGFKVGYNREDDGSFYSWMGGILPGYRRKAIASALAIEMESFCRNHGYTHLRMKTRNQHKAMLQFALKNDFYIIGFKTYPHPSNSRIILEKQL